jgi:uncharacterized secreted protein with C-terminal beta-propeller domain
VRKRSKKEGNSGFTMALAATKKVAENEPWNTKETLEQAAEVESEYLADYEDKQAFKKFMKKSLENRNILLIFVSTKRHDTHKGIGK